MREKTELKTKRLVLRPLGTEDLQTVHAYASDLENTKWMQNLPNETIEETLAFLKSAEAEWQREHPSFYEFAVLWDGRHIGTVSLYLEEAANTPGQAGVSGRAAEAANTPGQAGELGWVFHKDYWGRGFAGEAAAALVEYAVRQWKICHFVAHCDAENIGSYRVMEKLGMVRTAVGHNRKNRASAQVRTEYRYEMWLGNVQSNR